MKKHPDVGILKVENKIVAFLKAFGVKRLLRCCNIRKRHGVQPFVLLTRILQLPFTGESFYHDLIDGDIPGMKKDTIYAFLKNPTQNWRRFLLTLSASLIINFYCPLTSSQREKVFILDKSLYLRGRSKKTELLSWIYDHINDRFVKGFDMLTLGWSDGTSFSPLDFTLLATTNPDKRIQGINDDIPKNSNGYKRRMEALKKATEVGVLMLRRALQAKIVARYVLFDNWFAFPSVIQNVKDVQPGMDVICTLKDMPTIRYGYKKRSLSLGELYQALRKRRGRAIVKANVIVKTSTGLRVRILFCQAKNKKGWVALLSTDLHLDENEIIRIYGKRWDIEVFFKVIKSHLRLAKEVQAQSYDTLIAHTTLVFTRYLLIALQQRQAIDDRSLDGIFRECIAELKDLTLAEAIGRLIAFVIDGLRERWAESEKLVDDLIQRLLEAAETLFLRPQNAKSES